MLQNGDEKSQIEEVLGQIPGVVSVRLFGDNGHPDEVHVLSNGERHPRQLVRDIESCLIARFNLDVDHRKISVAELSSEVPVEERLTVQSVLQKTEGPNLTVEVVLMKGEERFTGSTTGPASTRNRLFLTVQAALDAAKVAVSAEFPFVVDDVGMFDVGGERVVTALVTMTHGASQESLVGTAFIRRDEGEACVRAALAALNRKLSYFLLK